MTIFHKYILDMSHIRGGSIEWNKSMESKNNFFRILRVIQIAVLLIGTILFLAWCGSYLLIGPRTRIVTYEIAEPLVAEECCDKAEHKTDDDDNGLLPGDVIPQHYNLTLNVILPPEPEAFTTKGKVDIVVNCVKDTEVIFLHARDIHVDSASVTPLYSISQNELQENRTNDNITSDVPAYGTEVRRIPKKQMIAIHVEKSLRSGSQYLLEIFFKGNINNVSVGLYRSSYPSGNGTTSWFASTQFQPSDARRVFPCFDEPGLKATFTVSLASKKGAVSLSNMPSLTTVTLEDDIQVVTYMETPRMSTYILSFIVGEIAAFTEERQEGIKVWSRKDMSQFGGHAQNVTPKILHFLEDYIEIPFSMPKLDLVAVPNFLHAAMENWGLVIFSESALLYDPEKSSTENKVYVTLVIAHELAHQWFGNLVTPAWWDHIWLNEGFATYYEYLAVDALEPQWEITHVFLATIYEVMETDSLMTTRAMGAPVHPDEVLETFDQIAYIKGGAVVRMLHHFIGDAGFRQGLKNYLWQNSFKSATENSLWQNLNLWNRNKHDVKRVMTSWTSQSGYPVVKFVRDYENRTAVITQKQFSLEYDAKEDNFKVRDQRFWYVPVTYTNGSELDWSTKTDFWLTSVSDVVKDLPDENTWIIANIQQVGYYRVNYDLQNWELIIKQLVTNHTAIHVINRAQLLNDALNLARSDQAEYAMALNMTKYLFLEEEYLPWQAALAAFKYLDIMLAKSEGHAAWKEYVLTIMTPIYQKLGWSAEVEDGDIPSKFLRKKILRWSCDYDHPDCVENALSMFKQWKEGPASNLTISADDREIVLCTGISRGPSEDWELMWKRYLNENFKAEKKLLLKSLACTRETRLLRKLLKRAMMSSSGIPLEDGSDAFVYIAENFYGRDIVYDFFKKNMEEITLRFGAYAFAGGKLVDEVTASLNSENEIKELESILKGRKSTLRNGMQKSLQLVLQRTKNNLRWLEKNNDFIQKWLQENRISL